MYPLSCKCPVRVIAGTRLPYLQDCITPLPYVPASWLGHLRHFVSSFRGSIIINDAWVPSPPRYQDVFLMDTILQYRGNKQPSSSELNQFNECRMYIRAMFLSDIASPDGRFIDPRFLTDSLRLVSSWHWPDRPCPPDRYWRTWRRWLKRLFAPSVSRNHRITKPIKIDEIRPPPPTQAHSRS